MDWRRSGGSDDQQGIKCRNEWMGAKGGCAHYSQLFRVWLGKQQGRGEGEIGSEVRKGQVLRYGKEGEMRQGEQRVMVRKQGNGSLRGA